MDYLGIAFILIFVIFLIIGFIKGFASLALSFAKGLLVVILASTLCKPIGEAIVKTGATDKMTDKIATTIVNLDADFSIEITAENKDIIIQNKLSDLIEKLNLPKIIEEPIAKLVTEKVKIPTTNGMSCAEFIAKGLTIFICSAIVFFALSIILIIIFSILQKSAKKFNEIPVFGPINRILGLALGGVSAAVIVGVICYLISLVVVLPWDLSNILIESMKLNSEEFTISKFCYEHNIINLIISWIF